jgi:hypothetical protein
LSREFATGDLDVSLQHGSLNRGGASIDIAERE